MPWDITVNQNPNPKSEAERFAALASPGFGQYFTDHMFTAEWVRGEGWHKAQVRPYGPIPLDPSAVVFHYGQEVFEGLKAFRLADGTDAMFRPDQNARRMARSCHRLALPQVAEEDFLAACEAVLRADRAWIPTAEEQSMYVRPFVVASEAALGVHPANKVLFLVILSPAGSYFAGGVRPVTVWLSTDYVRAVKGGTGEAKCGGNYAASILAQEQAAEKGCEQVVYVDGVERRWIEEMGTNNLYFVYADGTLMTPALTGSFLPGITRASLLEIGRDAGMKVVEGQLTVDDLERGVVDGTITEVFGCGTAAVITPIGCIKSAAGEYLVNGGQAGPVTMDLRERLVSIQRGTAPDTRGWLHPF